MNHTLTTEQKQKLYKNGYLVLKQVIPKDMANKARRLLFERMGLLRSAAAKAAVSGNVKSLEEANRLMGRSGGSATIMNLFNETPVKPLLESAFGEPVYPVRGAQLAIIYPAEDGQTVNEAGFRNVDTPFAGWCGHLDGLWNGGIATPPVDRDLSLEEEEKWQGERGMNSALKYHPQHNTNISCFTALVAVALSDQRMEGVGNLGLLKGGHHKMEAFFRWQREQGGPLGPEGPGWPRTDEKAPNKHGLVHYPDKVKKYYKRGAIVSATGQIWPKPTFMKVRAGDAIIVHYATPHSSTRVLGAEPRLMVYFRTVAESRPEEFLSVYPDALCDNWLEWKGMREVSGVKAK